MMFTWLKDWWEGLKARALARHFEARLRRLPHGQYLTIAGMLRSLEQDMSAGHANDKVMESIRQIDETLRHFERERWPRRTTGSHAVDPE